MPSSATTSLRLEKQFTGENINVWGERLNANFDLIDRAVCGLATIALSGDHVLTAANWSEDQARQAALRFTGEGGGEVTLPAVQKTYRVWNAADGPITLTTGAGASAVIDASDIVDVLCDGTNVRASGFGGLALKDYISSAVVGGGATLPSVSGHAGKWLTNNGSAVLWVHPQTSDLGDIHSYTAARTAQAIAFAIAL
jgi:hypothetical protein